MKFFFFIAFAFLGLKVNSQIEEGHFSYDIEVKSVDTSETMRQMVRMYRNSTMDLFFDLNHARIDFVLGKFGQLSTRLNYKNDVGIGLTNTIYGKFVTSGSISDISEVQNDESIEVRVVPFDEYKTILGFKCKKYVIDMGSSRTTYWCTEEIVLDQQLKNILNENIPAFPLAFSTIENGMKMYYQAVNFKKEIEDPKKVFDTTIPPGFKPMNKN